MSTVNVCQCATGANLLEEDPTLRRDLRNIIEKRRKDPGALIQILHEAQQLVGYLPMEVQEAVAEGLNIPTSEVFGVVTFYSYFTTVPRGLHVVRICLGTACYVRGGRRVLEHVRNNLGIDVGGTTEDRLFSLEVVRCIGACGLAPVMTVDDDIHRRVKPSKVGELLAQYRSEARS